MSTDLPNIKLRIVEGPTGALIDWLNRGKVDFALTEEAALNHGLANRKLHAEELMLVGSAEAKLSAKRAKQFKEIASLPLILTSHHLGIRRFFNEAAAEMRLAPDIRLEVDSTKLMKELVERGLGYAILPLSYFRTELKEGRLSYAPIVNPVLQLALFLSWRTYNHSNPSLYTLIESKIATTLAEVL